MAPRLNLGHVTIGLGRQVGLGLKILQQNPILFKFNILGGACVISSSHMTIEKIECVYYTKPNYLYNL